MLTHDTSPMPLDTIEADSPSPVVPAATLETDAAAGS